MSDDIDPPGSDRPGPVGSVGSVGEEAAKLFGALADLARDRGTDLGAGASAAASSFTAAMHDVNEHLATGGEDCRYCPVCQLISLVRSTSPEVRTHLAVAASSLMQAAAGLLATQVPSPQQQPVERIDLDADPGGWGDQ